MSDSQNLDSEIQQCESTGILSPQEQVQPQVWPQEPQEPQEPPEEPPEPQELPPEPQELPPEPPREDELSDANIDEVLEQVEEVDLNSLTRQKTFVIHDACDNRVNSDFSIRGYMPSELDPHLIARVGAKLCFNAIHTGMLTSTSKDEPDFPDVVFGGAVAQIRHKREESLVGYLVLKKDEMLPITFEADNPAVWLSPYDVYDIKSLAHQIVQIARSNNLVDAKRTLSDTINFAMQIIHPAWKNGSESSSLIDDVNLQLPDHMVTQKANYPDFFQKVSKIKGHAHDSVCAYIYLSADREWNPTGNNMDVPGNGTVTPHTGMIILDTDESVYKCCSHRPIIDKREEEYSEGTSRHILQIRIPYLE